MHELRAARGVLRQGDGSARAPLPDLVALGLANDEIADRLVVSPATVRTHVSRAMTKLHACDRAQLVVFAYQSGLVAPGP
jgi:FixJ family two-component response regulator